MVSSLIYSSENPYFGKKKATKKILEITLTHRTKRAYCKFSLSLSLSLSLCPDLYRREISFRNLNGEQERREEGGKEGRREGMERKEERNKRHPER